MSCFLEFLNEFRLIRGLFKCIQRKLTGSSELRRICEDIEFSTTNKHLLDLFNRCLYRSRYEVLRSTFGVNSIAEVVSKRDELFFAKLYLPSASHFDQEKHIFSYPSFYRNLYLGIEQIFLYNMLIQEVDEHSAVQFDAGNQNHVDVLMNIWAKLNKNPFPGVVSEEWKDLGFQNKRPASDLRSMGFLALEALNFVVDYRENEEVLIMTIFRESCEEEGYYPFSISVFNLLFDIISLLKQGKLRTILIQSESYSDSIGLPVLFEFLKNVVFEFHEFWSLYKDSNIMNFNQIKQEFFEKNYRLPALLLS